MPIYGRRQSKMKTINLEQNSPEWLEFRRTKIGASDAPIILGVSPFKTSYQLYLDKVEGVKQTQNSAMKRGQEMEPEARAAFEKMYEMLYLDTVNIAPLVVQSEQYDWMIASLDGIDLGKGVAVEIKCPGSKDHQIAVDGKIPDHYIPQLQHQLFVTGLDKIFYFSYRNNDTHPVLLEYKAEKASLDKLIKEELKFLNCILTNTPPELKESDYEERFDLEFLQVAMQFAKVKEEIDQKSLEEQKLKDKLIELSNNRNCRGGKVKVSQCSRKGAIDYSKIEQLSNIDLESYRKPATKYTTVGLC